MKKSKKNLFKKIIKISLFGIFSTLFVISSTNDNLQIQSVISRRNTENWSEKSQNTYKVSQMASVNNVDEDEISKAILKIKPREDEFAPAIPLLFGALGGILFGGVFSSWLSQNPLPELPRLGNVGSYAPQIDQKPSENTEKKVPKRYKNNSYQNSFLDYFQKTEKNLKLRILDLYMGHFCLAKISANLTQLLQKVLIQ